MAATKNKSKMRLLQRNLGKLYTEFEEDFTDFFWRFESMRNKKL
jgi:hypothetical protein